MENDLLLFEKSSRLNSSSYLNCTEALRICHESATGRKQKMVVGKSCYRY